MLNLRAALVSLTLLSFGLFACGAELAEEDGDDEVAGTEDAISTSVTLKQGQRLELTRALYFRASPSKEAAKLRASTVPTRTIVVATGGAPKNGYQPVTLDGENGYMFATGLRAVGSSGSTGETNGTSGNGTTYSRKTMLWEGNWAYLTKCDSYSRSGVVFTCNENPSRDFVDNGAWIAVPRSIFSRSLCNKTARVCKDGACIDAKVMERSVTGDKWEGSSAVMRELGVSAGWKGTCSSSFGTATNVSITL